MVGKPGGLTGESTIGGWPANGYSSVFYFRDTSISFFVRGNWNKWKAACSEPMDFNSMASHAYNELLFLLG